MGKRAGTWLLIVLFWSIGFSDFGLKYFEATFSAEHATTQFISIVFAVAFVIGLAATIWRRRPLRHQGWALVRLGVALGAANVLAAEFLLRALKALPTVVVFPINTVVVVVGGLVLGRMIWHERLNRTQSVGIVVAIAAVVLLVS